MTVPVLFADDEILIRAAVVTDLDADAGVIEAKLAAYEVEADLGDGLHEVFTTGAFAAAVGNPSRVKVSDQQHNRQVIVGQAVELRDEPDGLYGKLEIVDTRAGEDVLKLLRRHVLEELSVEFRPQKKFHRVTRTEDGGYLVRHDRATLVGISPVSAGAYGDQARVLAVRAAALASVAERELAELHALTSGASRV